MNQIIKISDKNELVSADKFPYAKFNFEYFNPVQSSVFDFYDQDVNAVIASSTSSGKTVCAEMFLSHEVRIRGGKGLFLAPMKALAKEKIDDWTEKGHHFNDLKIAICTGDYRLTAERKKELDEADLIIMTNEMLSARIRNYKSEVNTFLDKIGTLVSDEYHLLGTSRGDHAEIGLMNFAKLNSNCRIVGLSATLPNVDEISSWMHYALNRKKTYCLVSKYRPCPLGVHYELYEDIGNYEQQEMQKVSSAIKIIQDHPDDIFLVFAHTKNAGKLLEKELKKLKYKVEFHNADLDKEERHNLENGFRDRKLDVLIATSTLAWGCFKHGTIIPTINGPKLIENLVVGDSVYAYDGVKLVPRKITRIGDKVEDSYYQVSTANSTCYVNKDHIFYSKIDGNISWTNVNKIKKGDYLAGANYTFYSGKDIVDVESHLIEYLDIMIFVDSDRSYFLHNLDLSYLKSVIQVLMDSDCCDIQEDGEIDFYFNDKKLVDEIQQILILFGIKSTLEVKNDSFQYGLVIDNENTIKLYQEIGIHNKSNSDCLLFDDNIESIKELIYWQDVNSIEKIDKPATFRDIEVEADHNYAGAGFISHNCNLPARRVIILGIHRGLAEVDNFDITQEVGRAGRPKYDKRGDAVILVPESESERHIQRLSTPQRIESKLLEYIGDEKNPQYKTLAFHLTAAIHGGEVQTRDDIHEWYQLTLANFQSNKLEEDIIDATLDSLVKCGAVRLYEGKYEVTVIGKISSLFYYSPFDTADLKKNFSALFDGDYQDNDLMLSFCLGNVDTNRLNFVSKAEKAEMGHFSKRIRDIFGNVMESAIKGAYCYHLLLNGFDLGVFANLARNLQFDFDRTRMVLEALDGMSGKWKRKDWFKTLGMRIQYGVQSHLIDLCRIESVGKVRAERLYAAGLTSYLQIANSPDHVAKVLNMKDVKKICDHARILGMV